MRGEECGAKMIDQRVKTCSRTLSLMLAAGLVSAAGSGEASAQYFTGSSSMAFPYDPEMYGMPGMPRPRGGEDDEIPDFDPFEARGRRGGGQQDDPRLTPKTDLGKRIAQLDLMRDQQMVLAARARLAAQARELMLNPPPPTPPAAPAGASGQPGDAPAQPAPAEPVPAPAAPAGEGLVPTLPAGALPEGMTPEMLMEMMQAAMAEGMDPEDMDEETLAMMGMGGVQPGGPAGPGGMSPEQMKAMQEKQAAIGKQAERFRMMVIAGDWPAVGEFLRTEAGEDALAIYNIVLTQLQQRDQAIVPDEVIAISDICPADLEEKFIEKLGALLKATQGRGSQAGAVAARIRAGTKHFGGEDPAARKRAATLLVAAGLPVEAQAYLPPLAQAREAKDPELLNLYAVYFAALAKGKQGTERQAAIDQGWQVSLEVLQIPTAPAAQRTKGLERALRFLADMPQETGDAWLATLFADPGSDIGWKAIDRVATYSRFMRQQQRAADDRLKALQLIKRVGAGIVSGAGENIAEWRTGLNMLTMSVLEEAELTKNRQPNERVQTIPADQLNTVLPDGAWLASIDPGLAAKLEVMVATTSGGSGETDAVLAMIRPIVKSDPDRARKLAEALIAAWPSFVKPQPRYDEYGYGGYNPYAYNPYARRFYGGGMGGAGVTPLTRAKQQRNLEKLASMLEELRKLDLGDLPTASIVAAFAASHSDAEVYSTDDIERVFGPIESMSNTTRRELASGMRQRLVTIWRNPQVQQQAQTRRTDRELASEVLRGYDVAIAMLPPMDGSQDAAAWEAACTLADLLFDKSEFLYGQKADLATYADTRNQAFYHYARAAAMYREALASGVIKPSVRIFVQWFSSALGASDLAQLTRQDATDPDQVDAVRAAIARLPDGQVDRHMGLLAKELSQSSERTNPELKPRFLRHAARIVGEHPDAKPILDRVAYYDDLLREIELTLSIDGPTQVGHGDAFGAQLAIWCTRAVSRESGGFSKYLQNEQWHPSTGQPVDYKDDLDKQIRESLSERFDVQAVYFHKPQVQPMGLPREGWEQWPLCYLLLKPKDPSVDRVTPLKMDMDFSDGQGMVVLPVTSQVVLIDAKHREGTPRPVAGVEVEQVLDDRSIAGPNSTGVARLEVRARGTGLMPALDKLVDLHSMKGVEVIKSEDQGLNIVDLDTSGETVVPISERSWMLELRPVSSGPSTFAFPTLRSTDAKVTLKRYADADLVDAPPTVAIAAIGGPTRWWPLVAGGVAGAIGGLLIVGWFRRRSRRAQLVAAPRFQMPDHVTPVGAIALLRRMANVPEASLSASERQQLASTISDLELKYFAPPNGHGEPPAEPELIGVVREWVHKAAR
jgi:hypothetical protein